MADLIEAQEKGWLYAAFIEWPNDNVQSSVLVRSDNPDDAARQVAEAQALPDGALMWLVPVEGVHHFRCSSASVKVGDQMLTPMMPMPIRQARNAYVWPGDEKRALVS